MLGLRLVAGGLLMAFVLLNCGGSTTADLPGVMESDASGGGVRADDMECGGAAGDGGCGDGGDGGDGGGGERGLEPYARLRTVCNLNVRLNRRGTPVCVSLHIH